MICYVNCSYFVFSSVQPAEESISKVDQQIFRRMSDLSQFFGTLKLLCDWLDANEKVINACAQNSKALWSRLAKLTSLMPDGEMMKQMGERNLS